MQKSWIVINYQTCTIQSYRIVTQKRRIYNIQHQLCNIFKDCSTLLKRNNWKKRQQFHLLSTLYCQWLCLYLTLYLNSQPPNISKVKQSKLTVIRNNFRKFCALVSLSLSRPTIILICTKYLYGFSSLKFGRFFTNSFCFFVATFFPLSKRQRFKYQATF